MKKAIVIGASSGIGRQLALTLAQQNYEVGIYNSTLEVNRIVVENYARMALCTLVKALS